MRTKRTGGRLLAVAVLGVIGMLAASGAIASAGPAGLAGAAAENSVVGAWHATVNVETPVVAPPFDTLYAFNSGGTFERVDGRSAYISTGMGTWRKDGKDIIFSFVLFTYDPTTGTRLATITVPSMGHLDGDKLVGTFIAYGVDAMGNPLSGFPKTGTVTGVRISPTQSS